VPIFLGYSEYRVDRSPIARTVRSLEDSLRLPRKKIISGGNRRLALRSRREAQQIPPSKTDAHKCDRIRIGAILWPDDDKDRAGFLLMKPRCFIDEECADEVIDKSTGFQ
jgi:hypothetical protein